MSRIPFIEASFAEPREGRTDIEMRFVDFLRKLPRAPEERQKPTEDPVVTQQLHGPHGDDVVTEEDWKRISHRARRIVERREAASGLAHLKWEDRERIKVLRDGARLVEIRDEHHADELAAQLHAEMPWMGPANTEVWQVMRRSVREGLQGLRLPPLLLDGPAGIARAAGRGGSVR